mmetsp:Transcript_42283/g.99194  ORF Transcript_42283/g.99194 Transcript_42283/m.99194 type:complete len:245 (-) Transcript_42283:793-1527(-)
MKMVLIGQKNEACDPHSASLTPINASMEIQKQNNGSLFSSSVLLQSIRGQIDLKRRGYENKDILTSGLLQDQIDPTSYVLADEYIDDSSDSNDISYLSCLPYMSAACKNGKTSPSFASPNNRPEIVTDLNDSPVDPHVSLMSEIQNRGCGHEAGESKTSDLLSLDEESIGELDDMNFALMNEQDCDQLVKAPVNSPFDSFSTRISNTSPLDSPQQKKRSLVISGRDKKPNHSMAIDGFRKKGKK